MSPPTGPLKAKTFGAGADCVALVWKDCAERDVAYRFLHQELLIGLGVAISAHARTTLTMLGDKMAVFGFGLPVPEQFTPGLDELIARP